MRTALILAAVVAGSAPAADPPAAADLVRNLWSAHVPTRDAAEKALAGRADALPDLFRMLDERSPGAAQAAADRLVRGWLGAKPQVGPNRWAALAEAGEVSRLAASFLACRFALWGSPHSQHQMLGSLGLVDQPISDLEVERLPHDEVLITLSYRAQSAAGPATWRRDNLVTPSGRLGLWRVVNGVWDAAHDRAGWHQNNGEQKGGRRRIERFNYCADRLDVLDWVPPPDSRPTARQRMLDQHPLSPEPTQWVGCAVLGEGPNLLTDGSIILIEGDATIIRARFEWDTVLINGDIIWRPDPGGKPNGLTAESALIACTGRFYPPGPDGKLALNPEGLFGTKGMLPEEGVRRGRGLILDNAADKLKGLKFSCPEWYGLTVAARDKFAVVTAVAPGSACDKAGVKPGDAVLKVNGMPVTSPRSVGRLLCRAEVGPGAAVVQVRRGTDTHYLLAPLAP